MNILKSKKFIISVVVIVCLVGLGVLTSVKASERLEEYNKYCNESCELTKVSKQELADTIETRESEAVSNIEEDTTTITETKSYLEEKELSDSEAKTYEAIAIGSEYDGEASYTTDELINLERDYNAVVKQLKDLKTNYQVRINKKSIKSYKENIGESKEYLKSADLSTSEKKKYDGYNEDYKAIKYDTEKDYTVKELGAFKESYKELDTNYSKLVKSVKTRIKEEKEQAEAEAQAQQEAQASTPTWSNDTSYSSGNTSSNSGSTSSNNGSTSSNSGSTSSNSGSTSSSSGSTSSNNGGSSSSNGGGSTTTEVMPDYCYASEAEAYGYGEAHMDEFGGFGVYPGCAENMDWWEIDWFEL
ncbi:MAG: hypothetical protein ACK5NF_06400 [Bacilli bacterium]